MPVLFENCSNKGFISASFLAEYTLTSPLANTVADVKRLAVVVSNINEVQSFLIIVDSSGYSRL
ncbi:MAG: hypothetical protein OFPI_13210 [Osedax symbiont Rs2]|nr:MAG: hypothetical protein OFPI_13210 [Osedax symbiont Rs2]